MYHFFKLLIDLNHPVDLQSHFFQNVVFQLWNAVEVSTCIIKISISKVLEFWSVLIRTNSEKQILKRSNFFYRQFFQIGKFSKHLKHFFHSHKKEIYTIHARASHWLTIHSSCFTTKHFNKCFKLSHRKWNNQRGQQIVTNITSKKLHIFPNNFYRSQRKRRVNFIVSASPWEKRGDRFTTPTWLLIILFTPFYKLQKGSTLVTVDVKTVVKFPFSSI